MKVGVLALQGDFEAHARMVESAGATALEVRTEADLHAVDGLVIPGGESTTLRIIGARSGVLEPVRERARAGMPILGTCAGMIACADEIADGDEPIVGGVDITVRRNAYGRQVDSFETDVEVAGIGSMHAVFIRAPRVERVGPGVEVLAEHAGNPVVVRSGRVLLAAFHPELADDARLHTLAFAHE
jgi:5'-phosphate synthase pdxT subunit